eukprot:TRINITY_DN3470_c0_g1_i1.p1 TRINITY_DN3470_c0_g1~~TRINITY_DN3470_c0_g1_i1.p1  ORF type:complete len:301 (+),score=31.67 TRINITY_DN3470_c0_g1_i1:47-949(+)
MAAQGGSRGNTKNALRAIQAGSGLAFSSFMSLHLANFYISPLGYLGYDEVQKILRRFYQNKYVEYSVIFGSLAIHITSSIALVVQRKLEQRRIAKINNFDESSALGSPPNCSPQDKRKRRGSGLLQSIRVRRYLSSSFNTQWHIRLHRYTGYFLMAVIGGHIFATRVGFWYYLKSHADFSYIAHSLEVNPYIFTPYYVLLGCSGSYHLIYGWLLALSRVNLLPGTKTGKGLKEWLSKMHRRLTKSKLFYGGIFCTWLFSIVGVLAFKQTFFNLVNKDRYQEFADFEAWLLSLLPRIKKGN